MEDVLTNGKHFYLASGLVPLHADAAVRVIKELIAHAFLYLFLSRLENFVYEEQRSRVSVQLIRDFVFVLLGTWVCFRLFVCSSYHELCLFGAVLLNLLSLIISHRKCVDLFSVLIT